MYMKTRNSLFPLFGGLALLLLGACYNNEQEIAPTQQGITLYFSPQGSETRANTDPGTTEESIINNLSLWFFETGASDTNPPLHCFTFTNLTTTKGVAVTISEAELNGAGIRPNGIYDVYAAANLSGAVPTFATLSELKQYTYTAASRPSSPFCMSGVINSQDFSRSREMTVSLKRQAVKLDITLYNETSFSTWTINSVSVSSDQKTVYLFDPATGTTSDTFADALSVSATATNASPASYTAYIYENLSDIPTVVEVNATVDGVERTYRAGIEPDGLSKLPRNSACSVKLRLRDAAIVPADIDVVISDWTPGGIPEINISDTYLFLGTNTVEVFAGDGGFLDIDTDAEIVHVDMTNAPGFFMVGHEEETVFDLAIKAGGNTSTEFLFKFLGGSNAVIPDGTVTISAGNIHKKVTLHKSVNRLIFEVRSVKINGQSISRGDIVLPAIWKKDDRNAIVDIVVYSNITWGCTCKVLYGDFALYTKQGKSIYTGIPGESAPTETIDLPGLADFESLMPYPTKIFFYVNSFDEKNGGVLIDIFEFTIDK